MMRIIILLNIYLSSFNTLFGCTARRPEIVITIHINSASKNNSKSLLSTNPEIKNKYILYYHLNNCIFQYLFLVPTHLFEPFKLM